MAVYALMLGPTLVHVALCRYTSAAVPLIERLAAKFQPPRCRLDSEACGGIVLPPAIDADGTVLPQDLPDIRSYHVGLPQSLPYKTFMKHEGSTYFW